MSKKQKFEDFGLGIDYPEVRLAPRRSYKNRSPDVLPDEAYARAVAIDAWNKQLMLCSRNKGRCTQYNGNAGKKGATSSFGAYMKRAGAAYQARKAVDPNVRWYMYQQDAIDRYNEAKASAGY